MSIEVLLIPIGIAAYGSISTLIREASSEDLCEKCQATRVLDPTVLRDALALMGAHVISDSVDRIRADSRLGALTFQRVGDVYLGRVDGGSESETVAALAELDTHVGLVMQSRTAAIVMQRAKELGFRLIEQHDQDGAMNYVFEEIG